MADSLSQKSSKSGDKSKHCLTINRTTSETIRLSEPEKQQQNINHPTSLVSSGAGIRKKAPSFQITSVTVGSRVSNDGGDDSADDLDESHTEDMSDVADRIADPENETPSYSEDTFSREDLFYNSTLATAAPVIPTSSQYGLAIVAEGSGGTSLNNVAANIAGDFVSVADNVMMNLSVKHVEERDHPHCRNERFKVVKIESTEPFKRGRWTCMDYLDHTMMSGREDGDAGDSEVADLPVATDVVTRSDHAHSQINFPVSIQQGVVNNSAGQSLPAGMVPPSTQYYTPIPSSENSPPSVSTQTQTVTSSPPTSNGQPLVQNPPPQSSSSNGGSGLQMQGAQQQQNHPNLTTQSTSSSLPAHSQQQAAAQSLQHQQIQQQINAANLQQQQQQFIQQSQQQQQQQYVQQPQKSVTSQLPSGFVHQNTTSQQQSSNYSQQQQPTSQPQQAMSQPAGFVTAAMIQQQQQQGPPPVNQSSQQQQMPPSSQAASFVHQPQQQQGVFTQPQQAMSQPAGFLTNSGQPQQMANFVNTSQAQSVNFHPLPVSSQQSSPASQNPPPSSSSTSSSTGQNYSIPPSSQPSQQQQQQQQQPGQSFSHVPVNTQAGQSYSHPVVVSNPTPLTQGRTAPAPLVITNGSPMEIVPALLRQENIIHLDPSLLESLAEVTTVSSDEHHASGEDPESFSGLARALQAAAVSSPAPARGGRLGLSAPASAASSPPRPVSAGAWSPQLPRHSTRHVASARGISPERHELLQLPSSSSGTSAVAIDNKIEQAMDLVKSHLMFAVREEVEVLKEKIVELTGRINQLEFENSVLKANASQETLQQLTAPPQQQQQQQPPVPQQPAPAPAPAMMQQGSGGGGGKTQQAPTSVS